VLNWLKTLLSGKPHFVIGADNPDGAYMLRWYLVPRNPWLNLYLHKFLRDDEDRALHDHPWWFVSVMLRGGYREIVRLSELRRAAPSIAFRKAEHQHRVVLWRDDAGHIQPCWTLVLTGRKRRTWGFWCPKGFVPFYDFVESSNHGNVGKGCGD